MIILILNIVILALNFIIYKMNKKNSLNDKIYTLPIIKGDGVEILNKDGKPVVIFEKPLK